MQLKKVRLGKTDLYVTKTSFGALPVQRISRNDATRLIRRAYESGINYFDTANAYTDSEEKLGDALCDVRQNVIISTKSAALDYKTARAHIEESLRRLKTDYIDIFQFHNPAALPDPNDNTGAFYAALEAKEKGCVRHIGITNHRLKVAREAVLSGNFETLQFPFCYLCSDEERRLVKECESLDVGFIAMKGLSGGMLNNDAACFAFMEGFDNVVPIWGIQFERELDRWLYLASKGQAMTPELSAVIESDRKALSTSFCRSCGYCLPCSADIDIPQAARMAMLLRRSPYKPYMSDMWHGKMMKINDCTGCGQCSSRCPYGLDTPKLLKTMLDDYEKFYAEHKND